MILAQTVFIFSQVELFGIVCKSTLDPFLEHIFEISYYLPNFLPGTDQLACQTPARIRAVDMQKLLDQAPDKIRTAGMPSKKI